MFKTLAVVSALAAGALAAPRPIISAGDTNTFTTCCQVPLTFIFSEAVTGFDLTDLYVNGANSRSNWLVQNSVQLREDTLAPGRRWFATLDAKDAYEQVNANPDVQYCVALRQGAVSSVADGSLSVATSDFCFRVRKIDALVATLTSSFSPVEYTEVIPFSVSFSTAGFPRAVTKVATGSAGIRVTPSDGSPLPAGVSRISSARFMSTAWEFSVTARPCESVTVVIDGGAAVDKYYERNLQSTAVAKSQFCAGDQNCQWTWSDWGACSEASRATSSPPWIGQGFRFRSVEVVRPKAGNGQDCLPQADQVAKYAPCVDQCRVNPTKFDFNTGTFVPSTQQECVQSCADLWQDTKACDIPAWSSCRGDPDMCVVKQYGLTEEDTANIYVDPYHLDKKPPELIATDPRGAYDCDCGANCFAYGDCCEDRAALCGPPLRLDTCIGRCGQSTDIMTSCNCDADCDLRIGGCCDDFQTVCAAEIASCAFVGCGFYGGPDRCACDDLCVVGGLTPDRCCDDYTAQC